MAYRVRYRRDNPDGTIDEWLEEFPTLLKAIAKAKLSPEVVVEVQNDAGKRLAGRKQVREWVVL